MMRLRWIICIVLGVAVFIEALSTPGVQLAASLGAGALVGTGIGELLWGDN